MTTTLRPWGASVGGVLSHIPSVPVRHDTPVSTAEVAGFIDEVSTEIDLCLIGYEALTAQSQVDLLEANASRICEVGAAAMLARAAYGESGNRTEGPYEKLQTEFERRLKSLCAAVKVLITAQTVGPTVPPGTVPTRVQSYGPPPRFNDDDRSRW